jgi:hypothetical protein
VVLSANVTCGERWNRMSDGINTLQEFMLRTKGVVYLLAIAYLIGFIMFWRFLNQGRKRY